MKVSLSKHERKTPSGTYRYFYLRWYSLDGRQRGKCIGRMDGPTKLSRRQAEVLRRRFEMELAEHPGRRDQTRGPKLSVFLAHYLASREHELAPRTLLLHRCTARYLQAFFRNDLRVDMITKFAARTFKMALTGGELKHASSRPVDLTPWTVDGHMRICRRIFAQAVDDDLILVNPFTKLTSTFSVRPDWAYVSFEQLQRLLDACPNQGWRMLLALCRLAGLRSGEALSLTWEWVDWARGCLLVWSDKTRRQREVPVCPELSPLLREAFEAAKDGEVYVCASVNRVNIWRDFRVICKRAGIPLYKKPLHTLRKNREDDWAAIFPLYKVATWLGHSPEVARAHYLRVDESDLKAAQNAPIQPKYGQKSSQNNKIKDLTPANEEHILDADK